MRVQSLRTASLTAASAVAIASVSLIAAPAANAATPVGSDIVGVAQIGGAVSADIEVDLYAAVAGSTNYVYVDDYETDATGEYGFDLDAYSATFASYKLSFSDVRTVAGDQLAGKFTYSGNQPTLKRATAITRPAPATVFTVPTVSLALQSGIKGTISVPAPAGYLYQGYVTAYDEDDNYVDQSSFDNDPANDANAYQQTTYLLRDLDPGKSYKLAVYATAYNTTSGDSISYVGHFIGGNSTKFDSAKEFTTGAAGSILQPVNDSLTNALTPSEAPSIIGQVAPGKTLSVDNGTWTVNADNEYTYQWLLNGTAVSTATTYTPAKADLGKTLVVNVTARNFDAVGNASTEAVKVGYATKLKAKAKKAVVKGKTVVGIVGKLKVQGVKKNKVAKIAKGKVTVFETNLAGDEVKVGKGKVVKGVLAVVLKGVTAGKHEFTVVVEGKKFATVEKTVKAKV